MDFILAILAKILFASISGVPRHSLRTRVANLNVHMILVGGTVGAHAMFLIIINLHVFRL